MAARFYAGPAVVLFLDLVALILVIVAATTSKARRNNSRGNDNIYMTDRVHCSYDFDSSSGLGIAAFILILAARILSSIFTKCMCCGTHLRHGCAKVSSIIAYVLSWITFAAALLCLWAMSTSKTYNFSENGDSACTSVRRAGFWFAVGFIFLTALLTVAYSACFKRAKHI